MRENCNFVVPVSIFTLFASAPFSWAHDTLPYVLIRFAPKRIKVIIRLGNYPSFEAQYVLHISNFTVYRDHSYKK